ncbi:MAG TPA: RidA family protein [Candidatus Acidoferrum sp.]|jgi:2-iminobutanoate/2-iminopropanoate deaminase
MSSTLSNRRTFAARLASLFAGVGIAGAVSAKTADAQGASGVQKMDYDGKPAGTGFITPLIVHGGTIYIAGQGAHSHDQKSEFPMDIDTHTKKVMDNVKTLVEAGGGTMDSILQLTVYLTKIDDYDGMNKVFKTYFPTGGPARTTVAVAALPGNSLVEINCTAAVVGPAKKGA